MSLVLDWFVARFGEKSTWAGLLILLSTFGVANFTDAQNTAIASFAVLLIAKQDKKQGGS